MRPDIVKTATNRGGKRPRRLKELKTKMTGKSFGSSLIRFRRLM